MSMIKEIDTKYDQKTETLSFTLNEDSLAKFHLHEIKKLSSLSKDTTLKAKDNQKWTVEDIIQKENKSPIFLISSSKISILISYKKLPCDIWTA